MHAAHISGLLVVIKVVDVPGQAKVSYLHDRVLRDQNIPGCQVSVNALDNGSTVDGSFNDASTTQGIR